MLATVLWFIILCFETSTASEKFAGKCRTKIRADQLQRIEQCKETLMRSVMTDNVSKGWKYFQKIKRSVTLYALDGTGAQYVK